MNRFSIGEVAIYWNPDAEGHLDEVTVISDLHYEWVRTPPDWKATHELVYDIDNPKSVPGYEYVATPEQLRKKRPPQDWREICRLDQVPTAQEECA